jgi:hypothetical protein
MLNNTADRQSMISKYSICKYQALHCSLQTNAERSNLATGEILDKVNKNPVQCAKMTLPAIFLVEI